MSSIDFSTIETIKVDAVIGFGNTCRTAQALKRNNLRFFSNPFDWMMQYSLDTVYSLLKSVHYNEKLNFFVNCTRDANYSEGTHVGVIDNDSGMISMHDFPIDMPVEKASEFFEQKFKRRFKNLESILKDAKNICFVTNRNISVDDMKSFIDKMQCLYKFEHVYYINIYDTNEESVEKIEESNATYILYKFDDAHPNGRDKATNRFFWLGNVEYWNAILGKITLNEKFIQMYKL